MARLLNSGLRAGGPHQRRRYSKPTPPEAPAQQETTVVPEDLSKVAELTDWVGDDPAKAQAVLDRELAQSYQRSTLVTAMETIVQQHDLI